MSINVVEHAVEAVKAQAAETLKSIAPKPGQPVPVDETIYKLRFKKGRTNVQEAFFRFKRNQQEAEKAAKIYCAEWKFRFIWVEDFLTDINSKPEEWDDAGEPIKKYIKEAE